jgi:hypothetical protein
MIGTKKILRDFWYGKPEGERRLGDLHKPVTWELKHREWRGVQDTLAAYWNWLRTLETLAAGIGQAPVSCVKGLLRYRWMQTYLSASTGSTAGWRGCAARHAGQLRTLSCHVRGFDPSVPPSSSRRTPGSGTAGEMKSGTGPSDTTRPWPPSVLRLSGRGDILIQLTTCFLQPHVNKDIITYYIDVAESYGLPPDVCSLPSGEVGIALNGDYPDFGPCVLFSNMACDGSIATSIIQEYTFNKPMYAMPMPMRYDEEDLKEFTVDEIRGCIRFLEEQLGRRFDWAAFFEGIKKYNAMTAFEMEKWEVAAKTDYYPINGVAQALYRLFYFQVGYRPIWLRADARVKKIMDRCVREKIVTFPAARHRAVIWSCAPLFYSFVPAWMYNCWGINVVMNMDSMMGHNIISTESEDQALIDLADMFAHSPMRTHAVGGYQHVFQLWDVIEQFGADMVIMYDQVTCKGMDGIHGMFEDEFRRRNVHAVWVPHDLLDCRTVTRPEIRKAVNDYMFTVMHEEPLDPSLVDFDDSQGW